MMYVRSSGNRPATTTPRPVFAPSLGRLRRRWPLGCWRPPFDDELLERREEEEEEEKGTEAREVRKRGRCCCCFQGVVWARVAVVVAVKIISLYISIPLKRIRCCWIPFFCVRTRVGVSVSFFVCVFGELFLHAWWEIFSPFFLPPSKTHTHTHTYTRVSSFMCVSVRVIVVLKRTI